MQVFFFFFQMVTNNFFLQVVIDVNEILQEALLCPCLTNLPDIRKFHEPQFFPVLLCSPPMQDWSTHDKFLGCFFPGFYVIFHYMILSYETVN